MAVALTPAPPCAHLELLPGGGALRGQLVRRLRAPVHRRHVRRVRLGPRPPALQRRPHALQLTLRPARTHVHGAPLRRGFCVKAFVVPTTPHKG